MAERNSFKYTMVIFDKATRFTYDNSMFVMQIENSTSVLNKLRRLEMFIITVKSIIQFSNLLKVISKLHIWNPNAKFIVSLNDDESLEEVFAIAWRYYIINIYVVVKNQTVYSYYPYQTKSCGDLNINIEFLCKTVPTIIFPEKVPNDLKGCKLKMLANKIAPYVVSTSIRNKPKQVGLEMVVMNTLADKLNFTEDYMLHNYLSWGIKLPNGTYTDMFGALQRREVEVIFGLVTGDPGFEWLEQSFYDHSNWWVPVAEQQENWKNLIYIFEPTLWVYTLLFLVFNSVVWMIFAKICENSKYYQQFQNCLLSIWHILLQGDVNALPNSISMQIIVLFWFLYSLVIYTSYQSQLVGVLTKPQYKHQISTQEELVNSDLKFGFYPAIEKFFKDPNDPIQRKILGDYITCPMTEDCFNRTAFKKDFAVMKSEKNGLYLMNKYYTDNNGNPLIYMFKEGNIIYPKFNVNKGFPLATKINSLIMRMHSNGCISKWEKDIVPLTKRKIYPKNVSLVIEHLLFGFVCLGIGLGLSLLVFVLEVLYTNIHIRHLQ